jgi:hypothetical protein
MVGNSATRRREGTAEHGGEWGLPVSVRSAATTTMQILAGEGVAVRNDAREVERAEGV